MFEIEFNKLVETMKKEAEFDHCISKTSIGKLTKLKEKIERDSYKLGVEDMSIKAVEAYVLSNKKFKQ